MISHHLLQLLLLTDWTKREANPTETFHVFFFFALRSFLWSNAQKNMKRNIWRWRESAALTFVVSVPLLVVSPSSPTFLSHQFIFPSCCFFDQSGSIFVSQNATGKSLSRLQSRGWRRRVWSSHSWTFDVSTRTMLSGWNLKGALITFLPPRSPQPFIF